MLKFFQNSISLSLLISVSLNCSDFQLDAPLVGGIGFDKAEALELNTVGGTFSEFVSESYVAGCVAQQKSITPHLGCGDFKISRDASMVAMGDSMLLSGPHALDAESLHPLSELLSYGDTSIMTKFPITKHGAFDRIGTKLRLFKITRSTFLERLQDEIHTKLESKEIPYITKGGTSYTAFSPDKHSECIVQSDGSVGKVTCITRTNFKDLARTHILLQDRLKQLQLIRHSVGRPGAFDMTMSSKQSYLAAVTAKQFGLDLSHA